MEQWTGKDGKNATFERSSTITKKNCEIGSCDN
jgi:hypothetical protein